MKDLGTYLLIMIRNNKN